MWIYQREGGTYWVGYAVEGRSFRESLKTRDKRAAELKAATLVKEAELRAAGVETHARTNRSEPDALVSEYQGELERRGRTHAHVQPVISRLKYMLVDARTLVEITPEWIRRRLSQIADQGRVTARTSNRYRLAVFGFFRWLVRERRWTGNPVEAVGGARETEPARRRRALTPEELSGLVAVAPPTRSTCYLLAATSGLRRSELKHLCWGDLDLEAGTVRVRAKTSKNRREATLPLPPQTVEALRDLRADATPDARVLRGVPGVKTLAKDLRAAGIESVSAEGVVDFHALRVTYGTSLARAGVPLAQAQRLLRHCDPKLTANVYTRLELHDARGAARKLGDLLSAATHAPQEPPSELRRSGT